MTIGREVRAGGRSHFSSAPHGRASERAFVIEPEVPCTAFHSVRKGIAPSKCQQEDLLITHNKGESSICSGGVLMIPVETESLRERVGGYVAGQWLKRWGGGQ